MCDPSTHGLLGGQCIQKANCFGGGVKSGNPTQCQTCGPGYDLVGTECKPACGAGESRSAAGQCVTVVDCKGGTQVSGQPDQCQRCGNGFSVNALTGQCACDPTTHGLLGGQCVQKANCFGGSVKQGNPTQCQTCGPGYDLVGNECKPACGAGELRSAAGQCVVAADCKGGTRVPGNPASCQSCGSADFNLTNGACLLNQARATCKRAYEGACAGERNANKRWRCVGSELRRTGIPGVPSSNGNWQRFQAFCSNNGY